MDLKREIKLSDLKKLFSGRPAGAKRRPARQAERPRYKELVGLKVGGSSVSAAYVANNGAPRLLGVGREPLESGVVVGGELQRPAALAEALTRLFDEHQIPRRPVRLGVAT